MRRRRIHLALAVAAGCLVAPIPSAPAAPGTLSGKLTNGKLPSSGVGRAYVRAIRATDGQVLGATAVGGRGAWKLSVEPGYYVLAASVVRTDKTTKDAITPIERVRSRRTTRAPVSLKRTRTPRPRRPARAAATPSAPVGIKVFSATGPNSQLGRGLTNMLITEMSSTNSGDCEPLLVEVEHRADVLRELALANSGLVDPRSRIPAGHLLDPAIYVEGTVTTTASTTSWDLKMVDANTGDVVGGDSGSADGLDILDAPAGIAQRLTDQLCGSDYQVTVEVNGLVAADTYVGTGLVTAVVPVHALPGTTPPTTWMGRADVVFGALSYGGVPGCDVVPTPHTGYVRVEIKKSTAPDLIEVTWGGETFTGTTLICPGATIPNGVPPIMPFQGTVPTLLILPAGGGSQQVAGGLGSGGAGWTNTGTVTVTRLPKGTI